MQLRMRSHSEIPHSFWFKTHFYCCIDLFFRYLLSQVKKPWRLLVEVLEGIGLISFTAFSTGVLYNEKSEAFHHPKRSDLG